MKTKIFFVFALVFSFSFVLAEAPTIKSFSSDRTAVNSRQPIGFSWTIDNGLAPEIIFNCPPGVQLWDTNNISFNCNTVKTISSQASEAVSLIVTNTSGAAKNLTATLTPKDLSGASYPSLARIVTVTVYTDPDPITEFTVLPTTSLIDSYAPVKFTWKTNGLNNVNFQMSCHLTVSASSTTGYLPAQILPCGRPIFSPDHKNADSLTVYFVNSGNEDAEVKFTLLPVIESGSYDASHSETITFKIAPYVVATPLITNFSITNNYLQSESTTTINWTITNAIGAMIKSSCSNSLRFLANIASTTIASQCGESLYSENLGASGALNVSFKNISSSVQSAMLYIIPQRTDGVFDSMHSKSLNVTVEQKGTKVESNYNKLIVPPVQPSANALTKAIAKNNFTKNFYPGARGADVTALQNFLKLYPDLYPEGLVTGYFGPATVRAVKRFQEKYKIASPGVVGYGNVGPKTRAKLNEF